MKSYNIGVREGARYVLRDAEPADMTGYVPTGRTQEWNYTGDFDALLEVFERELALGSHLARRECTLTRVDGAMAELVVTESVYESVTGDGDGGGEAAGAVGSSAANPVYEYSFSESQEPMITHPHIVETWGADDDVMSALQFLAQGGMDNAIIYLSDGKQSDVRSFLNSKGVSRVTQRKMRVPSFIDVRTRLTVSWEVDRKAAVSELGSTHVVKTPPGPLETPAGRTWLYIGGGYRKQGEKVWRSEVYLLSGPGGWDEQVYKAN